LLADDKKNAKKIIKDVVKDEQRRSKWLAKISDAETSIQVEHIPRSFWDSMYR